MRGPQRAGAQKIVGTCLVGLGLAACTAPSTPSHASATPSATSVEPTTALDSNQPYPYPNQEMEFPTPQVGWLIAGYQWLYVTHDGGVSWKRSYKGPDEPRRVDAIGRSDAWVMAVTPTRNEPVGILRTTDGGEKWSTLAEPRGEVLSAIDFLSPTVGWALTTAGSVLESDDGGKRWSVMKPPAKAVSLCATSTKTLWIGGENGDVYLSDNAGATWTDSLSYSAVPKASQGPSTIVPWLSCSGSTAWALYDWGESAGSSAYVVMKTLDAGNDWSSALAGGIPQVAGAPSIDNSVAAFGSPVPYASWFLGYCGPCGLAGTVAIVTTTDGTSWTRTSLPEVSPYPALEAAFLNTHQGWIVAGPVELPPVTKLDVLATSDAGINWRLIGSVNLPNQSGS